MTDDPIVAEVRRIREERARRFGYDIHKLFADLITRDPAAVPAHPIVADADDWIKIHAAREPLAVREEPPPK